MVVKIEISDEWVEAVSKPSPLDEIDLPPIGIPRPTICGSNVPPDGIITITINAADYFRHVRRLRKAKEGGRPRAAPREEVGEASPRPSRQGHALIRRSTEEP